MFDGDISQIVDGLNEQQREAVTISGEHGLIIAGAGSGKTRVLVHRIAWLLGVERVAPHNILAVTFTNKAAKEMRHRITELLGFSTQSLWVGTFHGLAHRLLRMHPVEAGLPEGFQVLDSEDQYRAIRRVLKAMAIDEKIMPPRQVQSFINQQKDEGIRSDAMDSGGDFYTEQLIKIYREYEAMCQRSGLVDFAELLLRSHELWLKNPDLLANYQRRFQHILVDEFQDTNTIQYAWVQLLAGKTGQAFIVGDDDQSIYGWRGARVENIRQFEQDFAKTRPVKTVRLEQNYRSSGHILSAANAVIANNPDRLGKNLWTSDGDGALVDVYQAFNEMDEARFVVERIQDWVAQGGRREDVAILYRSNAQSRNFEETLIGMGVPYRVYGGLRFFDRAEIKDALSYLRLLANRNDDTAFERVVNTPTRGIGERTLDVCREMARSEGITLWAAMLKTLEQNILAARAHNALNKFYELIEELQIETNTLTLSETMEHVIHSSKLREHHGKDKSDKAEARLENLNELVGAAKQFTNLFEPEDDQDEMTEFLAHAALEAGDTQAEVNEDCVQLMTLHSAKGLEFPMVFVAGMEEGLFPSQRSLEDPSQLLEERRIAYVGMTRARQRLILTCAEKRSLYGQDKYGRPSRFIEEIPAEHIQEVRLRNSNIAQPKFSGGTPSLASQANDTGLSIGQTVQHKKFGQGSVLAVEGSGKNARVQIRFPEHGDKWLILAYANLD